MAQTTEAATGANAGNYGRRGAMRFLYKLVLSFGTREKRMRLFDEVMAPTNDTNIVDLGGTALNWSYLAAKPSVTLINIRRPKEADTESDQFTYVTGDATDLDADDCSYDIAYSNSVIEHLHTRENQERFAAEARRVGRRVWVQCPAREFFLEPHLVTPFVHWLPDNVKRKIYRNVTVLGLVTRPSQEKVDDLVSEIQLLTEEDMRALFPDCELIVQRWLGMKRSYIAYRY